MSDRTSSLVPASGPLEMVRARRAAAVIGVVVGLFAFALRLDGLGEILTADEASWMSRAQAFSRALAQGDPGGTFQGTHPGVVPMLLIGGGIRARELGTGTTFDDSAPRSFLVSAKAPLALVVSALIGLAAALLTLLWGPLPGLASGVLLSVHPFLLGLGQLAHVDALLSVLMLVSLLSLFLYLRSGRRRTLGLSGVFTGLALLTKLPALTLLPVVLVLLFLREWRAMRQAAETRSLRRPDIGRSLKRAGAHSLLWLATAGGLFVFLWPTMWMNVFPNIRYAARDTRNVVTRTHEGALVESEGRDAAFYLRAFFARTPLALILFSLGGVLVAIRRSGPTRREALALLASAVIVTAALNLAGKRADRYLAPVMTMTTVLAGLGLAPFLARGAARRLLAGTTIFGLVLQDLLQSPYALAYISPFVWTEAQSQSGWGEGLDAAARFLDTHPLADELYVASWYPVVFQAFFQGKVLSLSSRDDRRVVYVVLYRNMGGRGSSSAATEVLEEFRDREPVARVRVLGTEMAWIYRTESVDLFPEHAGELVGETALNGKRSAPEKKVSSGALAFEVGQFILPLRDNLYGIRLAFSTFSSRPNTAEVIVHLRDDPDGNDLRTMRISALDLADGEWHTVRFEPIANSQGERLYLAVTSPDGAPGNAVTLRYQPKDILPGALVILRKPPRAGVGRERLTRPGDLAYDLLYDSETP